MPTITPHKQIFRALADTYISVQKERIRAENRLRNISLQMDEGDELREKILNHLAQLQKIEKSILKDAEEVAQATPVYAEFLSRVKGIGAAYTIKLLSLPLKLGTPLSSWNAYFGLVPAHYLCECEKGHKFMYPKYPTICPVELGESIGVEERERCGAKIIKAEYIPQAPRLKRGYKPFWNTRARSLYFNIAKQFVMLGDRGFYGRAYRQFKQRILQRQDLQSLPDIRKDAMARRSTFKLFLAHFYEAYHELEDIDYRIPYAFEYLKHDEFISWQDVIAQGG